MSTAMNHATSAVELAPLEYATPGAPPGFQKGATSALSFADTIERLKQALAAEDLWLIHEIDPQMLLQRGGHAIASTRQLLFFHPRYMVRLLQADPAALIEAPLKLAVMESPVDATVAIRWHDPVTAFDRYGNDALSVLAREFQDLYARLLEGIA
jgi:uncharacterized protein (DUF302 family)